MRMQRSLLGIAAIAALPLLCGTPGYGTARVTELREAFDMNLRRFTGQWYELARTPNKFEDNTLRKGGELFSACYNAEARYTLESPRKLRIRNSCLRRSKQGTVIEDAANGLALVKGAGGRMLKVAFGPAVARAVQRLLTGGGADYWIYCLGPPNQNGLYDWAVVSGPDKDFIFLMTREKSVSGRVKKEMLACARRNGLPVQRLIYRQR